MNHHYWKVGKEFPLKHSLLSPSSARIARTTGWSLNSSYVRMGALSSEHTTQWFVNFTRAGYAVLVGVAAEDADLEPNFT